MIQAKSIQQDSKAESIEAEARARIDYLTSNLISLDSKEREHDSLSAPEIATCNRHLTPIEIRDVINTQIPNKWNKRISKIIWK
jgi:hypothetical protein